MQIQEQIKELNKLLDHLKKVKDILEIKEDDTDQEIIFKTYAKFHNAKKVSEHLKGLNIKTSKGLIFTYPKVKEYLNKHNNKDDFEKLIDADLYKYVQDIRNKNRARRGLNQWVWSNWFDYL